MEWAGWYAANWVVYLKESYSLSVNCLCLSYYGKMQPSYHLMAEECQV